MSMLNEHDDVKYTLGDKKVRRTHVYMHIHHDALLLPMHDDDDDVDGFFT